VQDRADNGGRGGPAGDDFCFVLHLGDHAHRGLIGSASIKGRSEEEEDRKEA
jgi:hypothetical protein